MRSKIIIIVLFLLSPLVFGSVNAETFTSQPTTEDLNHWDTFILQSNPDTNYKTNTIDETYNTGENTIVRFDLSSLAGKTVTSATFSYWGYVHSEDRVSVFRILPANQTTTDMTWNTVNGSDPWAGSAGCTTPNIDFNGTAMGTNPDETINGAWNNITLNNDEMEAMILHNSGFLIKTVEGFYAQFFAMVSSFPSGAPKLVIEYTDAPIPTPTPTPTPGAIQINTYNSALPSVPCVLMFETSDAIYNHYKVQNLSANALITQIDFYWTGSSGSNGITQLSTGVYLTDDWSVDFNNKVGHWKYFGNFGQNSFAILHIHKTATATRANCFYNDDTTYEAHVPFGRSLDPNASTSAFIAQTPSICEPLVFHFPAVLWGTGFDITIPNWLCELKQWVVAVLGMDQIGSTLINDYQSISTSLVNHRPFNYFSVIGALDLGSALEATYSSIPAFHIEYANKYKGAPITQLPVTIVHVEASQFASIQPFITKVRVVFEFMLWLIFLAYVMGVILTILHTGNRKS